MVQILASYLRNILVGLASAVEAKEKRANTPLEELALVRAMASIELGAGLGGMGLALVRAVALVLAEGLASVQVLVEGLY